MTDKQNITANDIESKFRDIADEVDSVKEDSKKKIAIGGIIATVLILLVVFILGKKSGKQKSSVLQIRRM